MVRSHASPAVDSLASTLRGIKMSDQSEAQDHFRSGNELLGKGQWVDACEQYQKAVQKWPKFAAVHNNWGNALFEQKKYGDAVKKYLTAIEIDPALASYDKWVNALDRLSRGEREEAVQGFQEAV